MHPTRCLSTALLAGIMATVALPPAAACGYHGTIGNYLSVMHPDSLIVAVALRRASNEGIIDAEEASFSVRQPALYMDAVHRLHQLEAALTKSVSPGESPPSFAIGFVESGLWTRYTITEGHVQMEIHASGPMEGDAVVLTAEPVLERMLSGTLSSEDALSRELIVIDAPSTDTQSLRKTLARTFHGADDSPSKGANRQTSNSRPRTDSVKSSPEEQESRVPENAVL